MRTCTCYLSIVSDTVHDLSCCGEQWEATQDNLKLTMQRNAFGLHMPMRTLMERKIVSRVSDVLRRAYAVKPRIPLTVC